MKSRVKIAALAVALAAVTVPPKFIEQPATLNNGQAAKLEVKRFLATISDTPPAVAPLFSATMDWAGWQFSVRGCQATAFTSPVSGYLVERIRLQAEPNERVSLLFQGDVVDAPPVLSSAWNIVADRLLYPIGLIPRQEWFLIVLVAPEQCADKVETLDWPENLRLAES